MRASPIRWWARAAYRIALVYVAGYVLTIAALGLAVYLAADSEIREQQDDGIAAEMRELVEEYRLNGLTDLRQTIATREAGGGNGGFDYGLFDTNARKLAGDLTIARPRPGWQWATLTRANGQVARMRLNAIDLPQHRRLVVALDDRAAAWLDATIFGLFLAAILVALVLGLVGALILGGYLRRRLDAVVSTARTITAGEFGERVPVGPLGDEFDRLGAALNAMLDRIAQLVENLRQVSGDVAHDLRTPLARLRGEIELARNGAPEAATQRDALDRALQQSDDLLRLFAAILRISEVEGGAIAAGFARVDLSALAEDLAESYAPAVADGGRSLAPTIATGLVVRGDRELIAQALINLLDNAQRHTPLGTTITLAAAPDADGVRLTVADNGPGVPAADRARVVRRFVRLDPSRGSSGHGLGLNLVAAIASAHRGRLLIEDNAPGLRATIWLPISG